MCFYNKKPCFSWNFSKPSFGTNLVGSSNGLICIALQSGFTGRLVVANPLTRVVKSLSKFNRHSRRWWELCWGFGYDSSTDDYKVLLGLDYKNGKLGIRFSVLTLKTNVWKHIGCLDYYCINNIGMLCNGAIHWFMTDENNRTLILSFDLSKEEFKEIPQPNDPRYNFSLHKHYLGITEDCLCIFTLDIYDDHRWVMKNYNVQQSWALLPYLCKMDGLDGYYDMYDYDKTSHFFMDPLSIYPPHMNFFPYWFRESYPPNFWRNANALVFEPSLVSPHLFTELKRKRDTINYDEDKVSLYDNDIYVLSYVLLITSHFILIFQQLIEDKSCTTAFV